MKTKVTEAWRIKYGEVQGKLLLKYRAKIAAQAKAKKAKSKIK